MKNASFVFLIILADFGFALDLVLPQPADKEINRQEAWKHGIVISSKVVKNIYHFSVGVNERLSCPVSELSVSLRSGDQTTSSEPLKLVDGLYVGNFDLTEFDKANIHLSCSKKGIYYNNWSYSLVLWESKSLN